MGDEEVEIVEEGTYVPKKKPALDSETKKMLLSRKKPVFIRQQYHQYKRLSKKWLHPRGLHSKLRKGMRYRTPRVRIGYRTPKKVRGLHPSGFEEVMVHNINDMEGLDPEKQAVRISGGVGGRKREDIVKKADEMGIRILNRGV